MAPGQYLTAGASAGVGVGAGLVTSLAVIAGLWVLRRYRRRQRTLSSHDVGLDEQKYRNVLGSTGGTNTGMFGPYIGPQELETRDRPRELQASEFSGHELGGNNT